MEEEVLFVADVLGRVCRDGVWDSEVCEYSDTGEYGSGAERVLVCEGELCQFCVDEYAHGLSVGQEVFGEEHHLAERRDIGEPPGWCIGTAWISAG